MQKPVVLAFVGYYLPGFKSGGPIRTLCNMVEILGDDLDFRIVTADRDYQDSEPYPGVAVDQWVPVGKAQVYYTSPYNRTMAGLARIISGTPHDVMYLNSFFHPRFTIRPLLARRLSKIACRPTVIAPRGEFTGESWSIRCWKKVPFVAVARALGLYGDLTWQASSDFEAADIRRVMKSTAKQIAVVPNLPAPIDAAAVASWHARREPGCPFRVCSIARISPEKNLSFALEVLAGVKTPLEFHIYGLHADPEYWARCEALIDKLPATITVRVHGPLAHEEVGEMLAGQDLLFFPTLGENFGHVIYEALSSGLPVLISDQTPWRNLEERGVGWDLPLDNPETFREIVEAQAALDDEARAAQRHKALAYAQQVAADGDVLSRNRALFTDLAAGT